MSGKIHHHKSKTAKHVPKTQPIEEMVQAREPDVLKAAAAHPGMTEDIALAFLTRRDFLPRLSKPSRKMAAR